MGASTGNMLVDDSKTLQRIFASTPLMIATHCEDTATIQDNEARARARWGDDIPIAEHPNIRSVEVCYKSSSLDAVNDGRIDLIATELAPHTADEKAQKYPRAPSGLPLVQHALLTLREHVHAGRLTIECVVEKTAHAPARLFNVAERGFIRRGYWADLTLIDPNLTTEVDTSPVYSKCGWTPFGGFVFRSRVVATFVNGTLMYRDGVFESDETAMPLHFVRE